MAKEAYIRRKDKTELAGMVEINIPFKQYLHVYIWSSKEAMYQNTDFERNNYGACYAASVYTKHKFGEIHLVEGEFGAGLFAHELQHFILHWIHEYGLLDLDKEDICLMAGGVTNKFWTWFHPRSEK